MMQIRNWHNIAITLIDLGDFVRNGRSYPETGFEEIGSLATVNNIALPRSRLLARNNFRVARHAGVIPSRRSIACAPIHYRC